LKAKHIVVEAESERYHLLLASAAFEGCSDTQLAEIADLLEPVHFDAGEAIVEEGEPADRWYVIADGTAAVTHSDLIGQSVTLAVLGPADSFGERALLNGTQLRSATVTALTRLEAFALSRADALAHISDAVRARIQQRLDAMAIDTALKRASPYASLPQSALRSLASELQSEWVRRGEVVILEGDVGDRMYLIRSGSVEVVKGKRRVAVLRPGDSFGEVAVLTSVPRTATVRALEESELLALSGDAFRAMAHEHSAIAEHFRELVGARFHGAPGQHLLLPDPLSTIMPLVGVRRRKRYWLVLCVGILLFVLLTVAAQMYGGRTAIYAVTVVGALIGPVVFVQYLAESNLLAERPVELFTAAVLGAALGLPPAFWLQRESGILPVSLPAALLIASIEEPAKLLGVLWLLRVPALRFRMDGVIFGAAAGMGFAALETSMYALARVETVGALVGVLWLRALLSPFTHGTWTAIACASLWRKRTVGLRSGAPRIVVGLLAAIVLHGLFDWPGFPVPLNFVWLLVVGVVSVLLLRTIRQQAGREEARAVTAFAPEIAHAAPRTVGVRCAGCGRRAPPGARYCPRCGLALRRAERAS
jgi:CRP-like cAMP-binding protein/RsiW-degrading membrane proteinase PrsW (M82 family)